MKVKHARVCVFVCLLVILLGAPGYAETESEMDILDLTQYRTLVDEFGMPTTESVKEIAEAAQSTFDAGDYEVAIPLLEEWAQSANWLANMIVSGLKPFYRASYDDRKEFSYSKVAALVVYETTANSLKRDRNHAMVMIAECHVQTGRLDVAVSMYMKALNLLDVNDWEWWTRAANGLFELIGVPPMMEKPSSRR